MDVSASLGRTQLLGGLSADSLERIARDHTIRTVPGGALLFQEGDPGEAMFVLISGSMRLYKTDEEGRETVIHMVRAGESFAEVILFDHETYPVTAAARETSRVARIGRDHVNLLLEDQVFRSEFLANLGRKLRFLAEQVYVLSSSDVRERLVRFVVRRYGRRASYRLDLSKQEVAAAIHTTPETLSRALSRLDREGLLRWHSREVWISPELMEQA